MNIGIGIALGLLFGIPLWIATDSVAFIGAGLPIGVAIGVALDSAKKNQDGEDDDEDGEDDDEGGDPSQG